MRLDKYRSKHLKQAKGLNIASLGDYVLSVITTGVIVIYFIAPCLKEAKAMTIPCESSTLSMNSSSRTLPMPITIATPQVTPTTNGNSNPNVTTETKKLIALTFDDGPTKITPEILQILKDYNCHATFFVLGCNAKQYPNIVLQAYLDGNEIGDHSYDHAQFSRISKLRRTNEIDKTADIIYSVTNKYPTLVRTPYGEINKNIIKDIEQYPIIYWTIDPRDWNKAISMEAVVNNILNNAKDGSIILCHDTSEKTKNAIKKVIPKLQNDGFKIVSVSEMFGLKNINLENGKVYNSAKILIKK